MASQVAQVVRSPSANAGETDSDSPWVRKIWRRAWQPNPVFMRGESHGQRSLAGYSLWSYKESYATEQRALSLSTVS